MISIRLKMTLCFPFFSRSSKSNASAPLPHATAVGEDRQLVRGPGAPAAAFQEEHPRLGTTAEAVAPEVRRGGAVKADGAVAHGRLRQHHAVQRSSSWRWWSRRRRPWRPWRCWRCWRRARRIAGRPCPWRQRPALPILPRLVPGLLAGQAQGLGAGGKHEAGLVCCFGCVVDVPAAFVSRTHGDAGRKCAAGAVCQRRVRVVLRVQACGGAVGRRQNRAAAAAYAGTSHAVSGSQQEAARHPEPEQGQRHLSINLCWSARSL